MFGNLIYLILVVLLISLAGEQPSHEKGSGTDFAKAMGLYLCVLGFIYLQNRISKRFNKVNTSWLLLIANLALILFLSLYQFYFQGYRLLGSAYQTPNTLFCLFLYFFGNFVFHATLPGNDLKIAKREFRAIVPFLLPFASFTLFLDVFHFFNPDLHSRFDDLTLSFILLGASLFFMIAAMVFLPAAIQVIWQCKPLPDSLLKVRLEALCQKANFKHAGIMTWPILENALTAAVVGIIPRYRYVMFTEKILRKLSPDAIEAVLAHEIGHSYHKHLLIFPWILFGMFVFISLISTSFENDLFLLYASYAIGAALYFRIVFGYFSRAFERQADLYVFRLNMNPRAMIEALNDVAVFSGNIHSIPSWHHGSIQERIEFLKQAESNPQLIKNHDLKVKSSLIAFAFLLSIGLYILFSL